MASTVFGLTLRVMVVTLTITIATLAARADDIPCNAVTTCRIGKEKWIVKATVTASPHRESKKLEIRNRTSIKRLYDEVETVTSGSTSTAAHCSFEATASEDLGALLDAGDGALVTLVAGEARLTAHRAVLAARSPAFAAMLCHGSQAASSGLVPIPDVEGVVLRQILAYLYTLRAPQLPGMAPQLLAAVDKFGLSDLKSHSEAQVAAQLDVETAAATAVLAIKHSSTSLRQAAIAFIRAHWVQVIATQGWADAAVNQSEYMTEVYRLLSELSVEASTQNASLGSTPAAADSQSTTEAQSSQGQAPVTSADSQPTTEDQSSQGQTPATSASPTPSSVTPTPDDDAVSSLRILSSEEKGRRLREAAKEGRVGEAEALLAAGADVEAGDQSGWTALHHVAGRGHVEVARRLLGAGAQVGGRNNNHWTPLHIAAYSGDTAVARLLLAAGADPNARDYRVWTPLHWAANRGHAETAAALLQWGADRGARNDNGRTPLDTARVYNKQQVVALLT